MIRYFGVGSGRVVKGGVVRLLALIESTSHGGDSIRRLKPIVNLVGQDFRTFLTDSPGVAIGSFVSDVDTSHLPAGGYELELRVDHDEVSLDEVVWILESRDYINLLQEEVPRADLSELLNSLNTENANQPLVQQLVQTIIHEKLEGFLRLRYTLAIVPTIKVSFDGMPRWPLNLILYLTEVFADECRAVLIHGVDSYDLRVTFTAQLYQFYLSAQLDTFTSVTAADLPGFDLSFLPELFAASDPKLELNVTTKVIRGYADLTLSMRHPYYSVATG
jgi:hypothetical protein